MATFRDKRGRWVADWYDQEGHRRRQVFPDRLTALKAEQRITAAVQRRRTLTSPEQYPPRPLAEAVTAFAAAAPSRQRNRKAALFYLVRALGPATDLPTIQRAHVQSYIAALRRVPLAPRTVYAYHVQTAAFFNWCVAQGWLPTSPQRGAPLLRAPRPHVRLLTPEQLDRLLHHADPVLRRALLLAADCGLRLGEIRAATRLDLADQFLHVRPLKNGVPHAVWLSPRLQAALSNPLTTTSPRRDTHLVPRHEELLSRGLRLLAHRLGIPLTFHQLRHYFATRLARQGEPLPVIQQALGHRSPHTCAHYIHLGAVDVTRALMKMHGLGKPAPSAASARGPAGSAPRRKTA